MRWTIKQAFSQHEDLRKLLSDTGDANLIEDAGKHDAF